mmetsp:Transcript_77716/g.214794  ORF Transcript_77716/g.214794 Transcript_77716/m.214794 type:complete len:216 (+) Transcript_77716:352-999(+)
MPLQSAMEARPSIRTLALQRSSAPPNTTKFSGFRRSVLLNSTSPPGLSADTKADKPEKAGPRCGSWRSGLSSTRCRFLGFKATRRGAPPADTSTSHLPVSSLTRESTTPSWPFSSGADCRLCSPTWSPGFRARRQAASNNSQLQLMRGLSSTSTPRWWQCSTNRAQWVSRASVPWWPTTTRPRRARVSATFMTCVSDRIPRRPGGPPRLTVLSST